MFGNARSRTAAFFVSACWAALLTLPACIPNRVTIDLAPSEGVLKEKRVFADEGASALAPKVLLIDVAGLISHSAQPGLIAGRGSVIDDVVARLTKAEEDPRIAAVILRINSPGGTVAGSETLYNEIRRYRERANKPVVISMAEVAASGGYYVALAADRVIAQPSTITGSIGVIIQTVNFSKGMSMIGIEARSVTSGSNKDLANPFEPVVEEHYGILQGAVNDFQDSFVALVRDRRPALTADRLAEATDGRIFTGRQALALGLVDACGDLRDSFVAAKELAGLKAAQLVKYHSAGRAPGSPFAHAAAPATAQADGAGTPNQINLVQVNLPEGLAPSVGFYYLWAPNLP